MKRPLIANEKELAERTLKKGFTNEFTYMEALALAKYYRHMLGYGDSKVRKSIVSFCLAHDATFQETPNRKIIKSIVDRSRGHFYISSEIIIYKSELDVIQRVTSFRFQRILLAMLAVAKLTKKNYVPTFRWSDVKKIVSRGVSTQDMRNCIMYAYRIGLIGEPNDSGAYHKLLYIENQGEPVFSIRTERDLLDLSKDYETFVGGAFRYCTICSERFVKTRRKQVLCNTHDLEKRRKQAANRAKNYRRRKRHAV